MQNNSLQSSASSQKGYLQGVQTSLKLNWNCIWNWIEYSKARKSVEADLGWPRGCWGSTSLSCSLPFRTCWVTQYAVLAVNVDDRKCQRFLEERPLVRYFFSTHPEKTKNNWPLSTIDIEREKICQGSFFLLFFNVFINIPVAHWTKIPIYLLKVRFYLNCPFEFSR